MGSINYLAMHCPLPKQWAVDKSGQHQIFNWKKSGMTVIEPGAAVQEAKMLSAVPCGPLLQIFFILASLCLSYIWWSSCFLYFYAFPHFKSLRPIRDIFSTEHMCLKSVTCEWLRYTHTHTHAHAHTHANARTHTHSRTHTQAHTQTRRHAASAFFRSFSHFFHPKKVIGGEWCLVNQRWNTAL